MEKRFRLLVGCSLVAIAALLVVGVVSHGVLRHIVQTSPLWIVIGLSARQSRLSKWAALPCFIFWLLLMVAIWLFLLGWARIVSGSFSPTEIAMTVIVGLASLVGILTALWTKSGFRIFAATTTLVTVVVLQLAAFRVSLLPAIAHR